MKKSFILFAASLLALAGCSRNQEIDIQENGLSLFARTESPADTKTVVESGVHVYWEPGDEIAVFMGEKSAKFTTDITASSATATFKGTFGDTTWPEELDLWAVYPFSGEAVFDGETITTTLPSEQIAREGSFGKDMNLAIAHSNSSTLQFYNVGGGIRFSVTEEGIKKVMFEGLSGEIISGKLKIGLEDGLPVVKEVTGGSQFITLLPPSSQEAFEPGAWYYIVAIPGSLEGGYKLRFYKDSDYARKVSEKAAVIKRSIFGNMEKADIGIEYEATTTHFPETEEEIDESKEITESIISQTNAIIDNNTSSEGRLDIPSIATELNNIENVESAIVGSSGDAIIVKQVDGVCINVLLNRLVDSETDDLTVNVYENVLKQTSGITVPSGKLALILAPFQSSFNDKLSNIRKYLEAVGYSVSIFENEDADLSKFRGDFLRRFDVIYIATHGNSEGMTAGGLATGSYLVTGTRHYKGKKYAYDGNFSDQILVASKYDAYYSVNTHILDNTDFSDHFVLLGACQSSGFANVFHEKKAEVAIGFIKNVDNNLAVAYADSMFKDLSFGRSATKSHHGFIDQQYNEGNSSWVIFMENYSRLLTYSNKPFYIFDPTPYDLASKVDNKEVTLSWSINPSYQSSFTFIVRVKNDDFEVPQSIYNHGSFNYVAPAPGEYKWTVIATNKYGDTFQSEEKSFTVEEVPHYTTPEAINLGLPSGTKWASFNLGATKPEEYGYYYAWGETEPKKTYSWETYKWSKGTNNTLIKYCDVAEYGYNGYTDHLSVLEPDDDAAHVILGGKWRMPTSEECSELIDECDWVWDTKNGVKGFTVTSKKNGEWIFIPATGSASSSTIWNAGYWGDIPSSTLDIQQNDGYGHQPYLCDGIMCGIGWGYEAFVLGNLERCGGYAIRPVYDDSDSKPKISASPTSLNYGDVKVGQSLGNAAGRVEFTNTGGATLSITSIDCPDGFSHSPSLSFPITISPGDSKTITFAFRPTEVKTYSGYIQVYSNASNGVCKVKVTGNGIE